MSMLVSVFSELYTSMTDDMTGVHSEALTLRPRSGTAKVGKAEKPDAWSGLTDPTERRRRQNRLNQRAYRKWMISVAYREV